PGKWYQYWVELFEKALAGDRFSMEQRAKRGEKEYYFDTSFNPIVNQNGDIIGLTCFSRDITDRKQIENNQAQLVQELEAANRELNEFAYIASHDLKSPLHAIGTLTNWIVTDYEDKLDEDGRDKLGMLRTRVQRMSNLLDGMLRYSMINRSKARIEHVVLEELVRSVFKRLTPEASNCTLEVETALPRTRCDKHQMDLVFTNLLGNAIRFMDKSEGHIRVGFRKHPESGAPECYVADNGPGMEARHYDRIFKIFQTLQPKDDFESTGIGLSLVHKIVSGWGGSVYPESTPGEGTTFYFTLPELVRSPQHPSDASVLV
ncbi:MAG: ATP-binding protein, partial [Bacteroidota bacterium]